MCGKWFRGLHKTVPKKGKYFFRLHYGYSGQNKRCGLAFWFFILRFRINLIIQIRILILHLKLMRFDHFKIKTHISGQYLVILITVSQSSWINLTGSFWDSHNFSFYDELYVTLKTLYDFYEVDLAKQKFTDSFLL